MRREAIREQMLAGGVVLEEVRPGCLARTEVGGRDRERGEEEHEGEEGEQRQERDADSEERQREPMHDDGEQQIRCFVQKELRILHRSRSTERGEDGNAGLIPDARLREVDEVPEE